MLQEAEIKFPAGYEGPTGTCDEPERALQEQHRAMKPLLCVAAPERLFGVDVDHEPVVAEPAPKRSNASCSKCRVPCVIVPSISSISTEKTWARERNAHSCRSRRAPPRPITGKGGRDLCDLGFVDWHVNIVECHFCQRHPEPRHMQSRTYSEAPRPLKESRPQSRDRRLFLAAILWSDMC